MCMDISVLSQSDVQSIWAINEQGLPGTGQVSEQELSELLKLSTLSLGVGSKLYEKVIAYSQDNRIPIAAEVNLNPPNPGSMRFHNRFEFQKVGVLHHKEKSVTMLMRE